MKQLICTCEHDKDIHDCPIHMLPRTHRSLLKAPSSGEYKLVCLCDCNCTSCVYTPLAQVLEKGDKVIVLYFDSQGKSHRLRLIEHDIIDE